MLTWSGNRGSRATQIPTQHAGFKQARSHWPRSATVTSSNVWQCSCAPAIPDLHDSGALLRPGCRNQCVWLLPLTLLNSWAASR